MLILYFTGAVFICLILLILRGWYIERQNIKRRKQGIYTPRELVEAAAREVKRQNKKS